MIEVVRRGENERMRKSNERVQREKVEKMKKEEIERIRRCVKKIVKVNVKERIE